MPNHDELIDILLKNRGITDREKFLNPSYDEHLYDPYLLKDMERAVVRIFEAIEAKEKIVIYSDYDCDGIPSAVIMSDLFKKINYENFSVYIPDRHDEGYGLHSEAVSKFIEEGVNLLITFDLGITAFSEVAKAEARGLNVLIIDHHLPNGNLPKPYALIDPKQEDCHYPNKMICAGGLAFKLIQALLLKYREYWGIHEGWEKWLLDLAGVATLSDQVPLLDENRVLAVYGLKVLKKTRRPGLVEIFKQSGVDISKVTEEDVTFTLAPKINAASRMDDPMKAFNLLETKDLVLAKSFANNLHEINNSRKHLVAQIMKEVKKNLAKRLDLGGVESPIIVIGNPNWRIGVLGIVASKITEEYKRPAFVWGTDGEDMIKGSCRSYGDVNLFEIMSSLSEDSLIDFGGHSLAGGFSVSHDQIHLLEERLVKSFESGLGQNNEKKESQNYVFDSLIDLDDINNHNYKIIEQLAPFGESNPKPVFLLKNVEIFKVNEFGKEKNHLEVVFKNSRGGTIKAIAFFKTRHDFPLKPDLAEGMRIDLLVNFEKNNFAGKTELRLRIVDVL